MKHTVIFIGSLSLFACSEDSPFTPPPGTPVTPDPVIPQFPTDARTVDDTTGLVKLSNIAAHGTYTDLRSFQASGDLSVITYQYTANALDPVTDQEIFQTAAGPDTQVSTLPVGHKLAPYFPITISDDGSTLSWVANNDPVGTNPDGSVEVFSMQADGNNLRQLSNCDTNVKNYFPTISGDGSIVAFVCDMDLTGKNASLKRQVFTVTTDGANTTTQLTSIDQDNTMQNIAMTADGSTVVFTAETSISSPSTTGVYSIFKTSTAGDGVHEQLSSLETVSTIDGLSVSDDGGFILYEVDDALYTLNTTSSLETRVSLDGWNPPASTTSTTPNAWDISGDGSSLSYIHVDTDNDLLVLRTASTSVVAPDTANELNTVNQMSIQLLDASVTSERFFAPLTNSDGTVTSFLSTISLGINLAGLNSQQIYSLTH